MGTTRNEFVYSGRVQGVGFRATAHAIARNLPVTGWVRNERDGSVTLQAQGEPEDIERLLAEIDRRLGKLITDRRDSTLPTIDAESDFSVSY